MTAARPIGLAAIAALALSLGAPAAANNYPTPVIADYVFACMASNGDSRTALDKCSCSIDVIASILPYEEYNEAETIMSMRQVKGGGEKMEMFRDSAFARTAVDKLKRAQIEAEVRCF